ncbi:MAG TPA: hypothetical protein VFW11_15515 [Cyclobacteriaceae bacterium]|nr:hypothetical protein [Cyclobacteriaceae bacterium]
MKNSLSTLLLFSFIVFLSTCEPDCRVSICHKGKIITIDTHAVKAHVAHGDAVDMDGDGYFTGDNSCSEPDCDDTDPAVNPGEPAPNNCVVNPCSITDLEVLNATCTDPTETYDLQLRVTFANAPAAGTLDVTIDGALSSFAIGASPQTVNVFGLPPTGVDVDVTASFSDDPTCQLIVDNLYEAPDCGL